ncbi:MAG: phosphate ABC transporter substrate-binding/OmpA family protein [Tepidisphaeraceae bacterium]
MKPLLSLMMFLAVVFTLVPTSAAQQVGAIDDRELVETLHAVPKLKAPAAFEPKDNTVVVELSEYAGYAGLIVANGGLDPNPNSIFTKKHGFKLQIRLSEEESWSKLNAGEMAASATTADVLAVYGKQFAVDVPALIGFSRGADGIVVCSDIKRINDLAGKTLAASQFTEADFLIRYLAREAGLEVNLLDDLSAAPDPAKLNLVYCADGFAAGDLFLRDVQAGRNRLAGCVTWAPKTDEVANGSDGKAHVLLTNRNLLLVADVLIVNRGFAKAHPEMVAGLVEGLIAGNTMLRADPATHFATVGKAFNWDADKTKAELAKVHLANGPENVAFFDGTIDSAGSFGYIASSAALAYGAMADPNLDPDSFVKTKALRDLQTAGAFANQKASLEPIRSKEPGLVEQDPILSKTVRFLFDPNSAKFDTKNSENADLLKQIAKTLQISPGSTILLRGHVDNTYIDSFRKAGGEQLVRDMALKAMQLSKDRAAAVKKALVNEFNVDGDRIQTVGRGWEEPIGTEAEKNRRVEVQWFTLE